MDRSEFTRRQSLEDRLMDYILAHPRRWIAWSELAAHGGQAWRSRLPAIRATLAKQDMELPWNGKNGNLSAYQLRPLALGPSAEVYRDARLFP